MKKIFTALAIFAIVPTFIFSQNLTEGPPVFHGAKVIGNYPGTEFTFLVPVTGERPISFSVKNLPKGLKMDPNSGFIKGKVDAAGEYKISVEAVNKKGVAEEELKIVIGESLCLAPPMGWNSWNVFASEIDEKLLMEIADAMVSSGMRDLGYQYINIDDFWHAASRDANGKPVVDEKKFPNGMKYLSDYVHSKGLKLGIYSCAGNMTCGKCFGGYTYEDIDAKTYAEWGIDLLKYDYCFAPWSRKAAKERYTKMGTALKNSGRSIVFSVCEWGIRKPWLWAKDAGGSYWRTTPDIFDVWKYTSVWRYSFMHILKKQKGLEKYAGPGHWNDPDMLTVGNYGTGKATGANGKFKGMSDNEYQTEMSLWCMLNAPLLASCDLRNMNEATKSILMNPEIIAINQDELGEQAKLISKKGGMWVYLKNLEGGKKAIAILNISEKEKTFVLTTKKPGIEGRWTARDVWQHKDAGLLAPDASGQTGELVGGGNLSFTIKPHETVVLRLEKFVAKVGY